MHTQVATMGRSVTRHGYSRVAMARRLGWSACLLVVAVVFVALVIVSRRAPASPRETPEQRRAAEIAFLVLAGLCVAGAAVSGLRIRGELAVEVIADAEKLTYRRPVARGTLVDDAVVRWDAIDSFTQDVRTVDYHGFPLRTIHRYTIHATDGTAVTLDDTIAGVAALADRIIKETQPRLAQKSRAAIDRGATIAFGPFAAAREGVSHEGRLLPWHRVGEIVVDRYGAIVIRDREDAARWARVAVSSVPNAHVFISLVETLAARGKA